MKNKIMLLAILAAVLVPVNSYAVPELYRNDVQTNDEIRQHSALEHVKHAFKSVFSRKPDEYTKKANFFGHLHNAWKKRQLDVADSKLKRAINRQDIDAAQQAIDNGANMFVVMTDAAKIKDWDMHKKIVDMNEALIRIKKEKHQAAQNKNMELIRIAISNNDINKLQELLGSSYNNIFVGIQHAITINNSFMLDKILEMHPSYITTAWKYALEKENTEIQSNLFHKYQQFIPSKGELTDVENQRYQRFVKVLLIDGIKNSDEKSRYQKLAQELLIEGIDTGDSRLIQATFAAGVDRTIAIRHAVAMNNIKLLLPYLDANEKTVALKEAIIQQKPNAQNSLFEDGIRLNKAELTSNEKVEYQNLLQRQLI